ncbi:MAG: GntR family transcriptional regulator [Candidatus Sphingomonas colombiensis]|nr:GntR family transcriptional regulator [Sphingomonas sp.]WEK43261.1 MAG: GntR family transcriptional regulator [Sphingomonas sp.]
MAPEAVVAERAYRLLKADIVAGRFKPGQIIVERALASEHGISIAPLRDGAQRLVGERLLEPALRGGYRLPAIAERDLRDLYQWHDHLVRLILGSADRAMFGVFAIREQPDLTSAQAAKAATALFRLVGECSTNREHAHALLAANDRLESVRQHEASLLPHLAEEFGQLQIALLRGSDRDRLGRLRAYHRRRIRRVDKIIAVLTTPETS